MTWLDTAITAAFIIYSFFIVVILIEYVSDRKSSRKAQKKMVNQPKEKLIPVTVEPHRKKMKSPGEVAEALSQAEKKKPKMPSDSRSPAVEKALKKHMKKVKKVEDAPGVEEPVDGKGAPAVWKERSFE